jgi:hypothetical protein
VAKHDWPFLGTEAIASGAVSSRTLVSRNDRIYRNVYMPKGEELTAAKRAVAAWLWAGRDATVAGLSAAALHGSKWIDPHVPAELFRRNGKWVDGILIHRDELLEDESGFVHGISLTTSARTAFDLADVGAGHWPSFVSMRWPTPTGLVPSDVQPLIDRHRGVRGLVQLRDALAVMDGGAESPQETRTRLVLVDAGLPRPQTQIWVTTGASTWATRNSRSASNTTAMA